MRDTPSGSRRRHWADGIEGAAGAAHLAAHTTEDSGGRAVVGRIVTALSDLTGKWMRYEERKTVFPARE